MANNVIKEWINKWWFPSLCCSLAIASAFGRCQIQWPTVTLLILGGLQMLVPLISRYIAVVRRTKDGWELEFREDLLGLPKDQIEKSLRVLPTRTGSAPLELSVDAQRILATLWHNQRALFGENNPRRWGFAVGLASPDIETFITGTRELVSQQLILQEPRGLVYLTNAGSDYCRNNHEKVDKWEVFYKHFMPA